MRERVKQKKKKERTQGLHEALDYLIENGFSVILAGTQVKGSFSYLTLGDKRSLKKLAKFIYEQATKENERLPSH
jgi:hypothetical protein